MTWPAPSGTPSRPLGTKLGSQALQRAVGALKGSVASVEAQAELAAGIPNQPPFLQTVVQLFPG